jgi:Zn-dependent membrane protease YugP
MLLHLLPYHELTPQLHARCVLLQLGLPVEFGVNYAAIRYMREAGMIGEEEAAELESGKPARVRAPFACPSYPSACC